MRDADGFLVHSFLPVAGNIYIKKCRQGRHRAQFSAMPSTIGTDYKNNNVCLYSIKIIYKIIIILYLVDVNGGFLYGLLHDDNNALAIILPQEYNCNEEVV